MLPIRQWLTRPQGRWAEVSKSNPPKVPGASRKADVRSSPKYKAPGAERRITPKGAQPIWWDAYFAALAECGIKWRAARAAEISYSTPAKWLEDHPGEPTERFRRAEEEAMETWRDRLRHEAAVRGVYGWDEPLIVFYKGQQVFVKNDKGEDVVPMIRKKSDLIFLALCNAALPEFGTQRHQILHLGEEELENLTDEELLAVRNGEDLGRLRRAKRIGPGATGIPAAVPVEETSDE